MIRTRHLLLEKRLFLSNVSFLSNARFMTKSHRKQPNSKQKQKQSEKKSPIAATSTEIVPLAQPSKPPTTALLDETPHRDDLVTEENDEAEHVDKHAKQPTPTPRVVVPPRPVIQRWKNGNAPPEFVINLDDPPHKRWREAVEWGGHMLRLTVFRFKTPETQNFIWSENALFGLMRAIERRYLFSNEQYAEMKAIAEMAEVPFQQVLDYNFALTFQFGCTSGTVPFIEDGRLLHYRNLDSELSLPQLLIQAHFKRRGETVAKAIVHLGHVVLTTGVRKGLSISINTNLLYAATLNDSTLRWLMFDPYPIAIRDLLLREEVPTLEQATKEIARGRPYGAFTLLCDGRHACSINTDFEDQVFTSDVDGVLTIGNHFTGDEFFEVLGWLNSTQRRTLDDSIKRVAQMERMVGRRLERDEGKGIAFNDLQSLITMNPIKNHQTALSCIMDPTAGEISWCAAYQTY